MTQKNVFAIHRFRMMYGQRKIYEEDTRVSLFTPKPAYNPQKPYPYFLSKLRRYQTPLTTLPVRNPRFIPDQPVYIHNEAFNPDTWWNSEMRNKRPWVTETESFYKGWPRTRLQSGILV